MRSVTTNTRDQLAFADSLRSKREKLQCNASANKRAAEKAERLRIEINRVVFRALNKDDSGTTVDLHGMDVKGAVDKVSQKEAWALKIGVNELKFIVGIGKHSDGPGALPGCVRSYLRKHRHKVMSVDGGGVLLVKLTS